MSGEKPRVDTVRLQNLSWAFTQSAVLFGALEADVFTKIAQGADTLAALEQATGIRHGHARRLLVALVSLGLVRKDGERFQNAPDVERFLVRGKPSFAGKWIARTGEQWAAWGALGQALQRQEPLSRLGYHGELTVESARAYHQATYQVGMGAARKFMREVDLSGAKRLLDLGGGSGAYSIVAAQQHPQLTAVVLDLPPVVEVAREFIAHNGVADRVTAEVCDFTADPLPRGADVVLMNSNLPVYDEEIIRAVIRKAFDALEPGGRMFLCGETIRDDWQGPLIPAMCGVMGITSGSRAWAHTTSDVVRYFRDAGFTDVAADEFIPDILTRVRGTRPAGPERRA